MTVYPQQTSRQHTVPQIRDNPMQPRTLIYIRVKDQGSRHDRMKRKLVGWDRLRESVKRSRLFRKILFDNLIYLGRQEEDILRFQVCQIVSPVNSNGEGHAGCTGMNHLAFIMQIFQTFQNVFSQAQDKSERESLVSELALQTWNAVAKHIHDEANVLASVTLEGELMREVDDVFEPTMEG